MLTVESLMKRVFRGVLFCPLNRGKSGAAWIGGGARSKPVSRMLILPYDADRLIRNADFKNCGVSRHHHPLNLLNPVNLLNPGHRVAPWAHPS